ncbi:MAG: hypothetical protein HFE45_10540 [Oscillospiraceae bacterium]|jgi:hypothetical protein|nr:hypothetical protein [Oscillospiraceae bacterium]
MKKLWKTALLLALGLAMLAGCSKQPDILSLDRLQDGAGHYVWQDLRWGMTRAEVEELTGVTLKDPLLVSGRGGASEIYTLEKQHFLEQRWQLRYHFDEEGLYLVSASTDATLQRSLALYEKIYITVRDSFTEPETPIDSNTIRLLSIWTDEQEGTTQLLLDHQVTEPYKDATLTFTAACWRSEGDKLDFYTQYEHDAEAAAEAASSEEASSDGMQQSSNETSLKEEPSEETSSEPDKNVSSQESKTSVLGRDLHFD